MVAPLARKSRIKETQILVPRIQGFPNQTFGSTEIRSSRGWAIKLNVAEHSGRVTLLGAFGPAVVTDADCADGGSGDEDHR
jgi:hypothetical protein